MKKRANGFVILILLAVIVFGGNAFWRQLDRWRFPWAYGSSGRPTLTGTWVGSLTTATGLPRGVIVQMDLPRISAERRRQYRRTKYGTLEGTALTCDEAGQIRSFTVNGSPDTRDATRMHLAFRASEKPAPQGLTLSSVQGVWDRGNTIHMQAHFYVEKDGGAITGPDYPDTDKEAQLHMVRGSDSEFTKVCDQVKQSGRR